MIAPLLPGDDAPWFVAPTLKLNNDFVFNTLGGRYVLLLFFGSGTIEVSVEALKTALSRSDLFDDERATFFGVTSDPTDVIADRIANRIPGIRWFLDYDRAIAREYRATDEKGGYLPHWLLLDPGLRVVSRAPIQEGSKILAELAERIARPQHDLPAPVLVVPRVFDPPLCRRLIDLYDAEGGTPSGFMRNVDGLTTGVHDVSFKRRSDAQIVDEALRADIRKRFSRFLLPSIERAFQFKATRIERYIVACYDGDGDGGYFRAHRDNTTPGTAHRRFACTINLNAEDYDGGDLCFPEFGGRTYRAPTGGAVVFSCSLLHEARPVTRGERYAYLPFFYDEAGARTREENATSGKVDGDLATYRA